MAIIIANKSGVGNKSARKKTPLPKKRVFLGEI